MKINASKLKEFVNKASLGGMIPTLSLNFTETGLETLISSPSNIAMTETRMSKEAFTDYKALGHVYIRNSSMLINYLKTFDNSITLEQLDEFMFKLYNDTRETYIILCSDLVCDNILDKSPIIPTTKHYEITKEDLSHAFIDFNVIKSSIIFQSTSEGLILEVGDKGKTDYFVSKIVPTKIMETNKENISTKIGDIFTSVYKVLSGDIIIQMGNDVPIIFEERTEHLTFKCVIAPLISGE